LRVRSGSGMRWDEHAMIVSGVCLGWLHYTTMIHCVILAQKDRERNQTFDMTTQLVTPENVSGITSGCFNVWVRCHAFRVTPSIYGGIRSPLPSFLAFAMQDMLDRTFSAMTTEPQMLPNLASSSANHFDFHIFSMRLVLFVVR